MTIARSQCTRVSAQRWLTSLLIFASLGAMPWPPVLAQLPQAVEGTALPSLAPMVERISPAVVNISSKTRVQVRDPFADDPFFQRFFGVPSTPRERIQQSLGSGVIIDARRGHVLTNNHVIEGADDIEVTLADGRTLKARLVGTDPDSDVALIQIPAEHLSAVPLADSSGLRVGDFVVAIGNPFGLGQTVTSGIVSALGRSGLHGLGVQNFIQTDASINPGNSGGALVNLRGELVGINTAIFSPSGGNVGIGFAVPSSLAADVLAQLLKFGEVKRGSLGVELQDVTADLAPMLGLQAPRGAVVTKVAAESAAARAGLRVGDVVVAVNQRRIDSAADLINTEALLPVGKPVFLGVVREQKPITLNAVLSAEVLRVREGGEIDPRLDGATLRDLASKLRRKGLAGAAVDALRKDSRAARNGLSEGDAIVAVNQYNLRELATLETVLAQKPNRLILTVVRNGRAFYLEMQ